MSAKPNATLEDDRLAFQYIKLQARCEELHVENQKLRRAMASLLAERESKPEGTTLPAFLVNEESGTWTR